MRRRIKVHLAYELEITNDWPMRDQAESKAVSAAMRTAYEALTAAGFVVLDGGAHACTVINSNDPIPVQSREVKP